jgi:hypothetical protein
METQQGKKKTTEIPQNPQQKPKKKKKTKQKTKVL